MSFYRVPKCPNCGELLRPLITNLDELFTCDNPRCRKKASYDSTEVIWK